MAILRAALIIARRDYVATVWSRAFILFLIGPLFPVLFGLMFGTIGSRMQPPPAAPTIAVIAPSGEGAAVAEAREQLASAFGPDAVPRVSIWSSQGDPAKQRSRLLSKPDVAAVLMGLPDHPTLYGSPGAIGAHSDVIELMLRDMSGAAAMKRIGLDPAPVKLVRFTQPKADVPDMSARVTLARGAQLVLLVLTMILCGMLLSNMMEEKSSKVIEILAAAVPVDAIFLGKLIAMLGMSLTGIAIWATVALGVAGAILPNPGALPEPAVGWPIFALLGVIYFMASYLLLGALFLGIGAQASTVREVQTLSMPVSMGQLVIFGLAAATVDQLDSVAGVAAVIFPWSSPFAMLARAAERPEIWPHLLAIAWQLLTVGLIIRVGARLFRRSVLKSGGGGFWKQLIGRSSAGR